jgi:hypothetical protein
MNIPDKLLINLKIISKVQKNGRISRSYDGIIGLESDRFYQPLKRFVLGDSRKQAVFEINSIISDCMETLKLLLNSRNLLKRSPSSENTCDDIHLLLHEMTEARQGIESLRHTYQDDPNILSQLDIILLKLDNTIKETHAKLKRLFPPEIQELQSICVENTLV